jgi:hypothetical protein
MRCNQVESGLPKIEREMAEGAGRRFGDTSSDRVWSKLQTYY